MLDVIVIADFASPFSWLAEAAMRRLQAEGLVRPEYRALEAHAAEVPPLGDAAPLARELGLRPGPPPPPVRTRKAHELAMLARTHGAEGPVRDALYAAYLAEGRDIARIDVLADLARAAGIDLTEAKVVLDVDRFAPAVERETAQARAAGIEAVPVLFLGGAVRVDGVFPLDEWRRLVQDLMRNPRG